MSKITKLTDKFWAVEIPSETVSVDIIYSEWHNAHFLIWWIDCDERNGAIKLDGVHHSKFALTPLTDKEWLKIIEMEYNHRCMGIVYRNYLSNEINWFEEHCFVTDPTRSGLSLLESKGLDLSKKYAIIQQQP